MTPCKALMILLRKRPVKKNGICSFKLELMFDRTYMMLVLVKEVTRDMLRDTPHPLIVL